MAASPSSDSDEPDHDTIVAATALPGSGVPFPGNATTEHARYHDNPYRLEGVATHEDRPVAGHDDKIPASFAVTAAPVSHAREAPAFAREEPSTPASYQPNPVDNFNHTPAAPQNNVVQPTQTFVLPVQHAAPAHQIQPDVVDNGPLEQPQSLAPASKPTRQNTNYGDWMAPAAAGVGAGVLGSEAYRPQQDNDLPQTRGIDEELHRDSYVQDERPRDLTGGQTTMPTSNQPAAANAAAFTNNNGMSGATTMSTAPFPVLVANSANIPQSDEFVPYGAETPGADNLGGLESDGAHQTGSLFPKVVRHDTDMSVSKLHVPGEYPPVTPGVEEVRQPSIGPKGQFVAPSAWEMARE